MKKWIVLTLALALALSLFAGCGKSADADETDYASMSIEELKPLLKTVTDGKLTVATSPDFAPYEFYSIDENENPTLAGFDIALAQYIADYLGLELEIIPMDFDGTLSELSAKKVDLALSGYSPDPAREDKMDFSDIYYVGGQSFVTVQDKADSFSALAEANKAEYQIGAQLGSIQADLAKENHAGRRYRGALEGHGHHCRAAERQAGRRVHRDGRCRGLCQELSGAVCQVRRPL